MPAQPKTSQDDEVMAGETPTPRRKEPKFKDEDQVTVLHGYGRVAANNRMYVDNQLFVGGVARNVPYQVAKHWAAGTRPDGKVATSRIYPQAILDADATEADFVRATGLQAHLEPEKLGAILGSLDADRLIAALGPHEARALINRLQKAIS